VQERIEALMSEVRRLKMKIAADKGDTTIVENLHALQGEQELVGSLQAKLKLVLWDLWKDFWKLTKMMLTERPRISLLLYAIN
jgi:hypothetical protein